MRPIRFAMAFPLVVLAAAFSGACSDPVPLIPRGAWSLTFESSTAQCDVSAHPAAVGTVAAKGELDLKADGSDEADVSCEVKASGGGFDVSGKVRFKGQYLSLKIPELRKDATSDEPSVGEVEFVTGKTVEIYRGDCNFYFVEDQLVDAGKVWGTFQCSEVLAGESSCGVQVGYFAFENCIGTSTDEEES